MSSEDNHGFKEVKYNSRRHRKSKLKVNTSRDINECYSVEEIINKVQLALEKFKESPFYKTLIDRVKEALKLLNLNSIVDIICYGLGNFSENICSKFQLASLLALKSIYSSNVFIYDPIFTTNEIESLNQLNLQVIENNEEGKRIINNTSTLVFMPHCSKQLTNNFLYANWSPLIQNCILLGNSWSDLECHSTDALLKQSAYFVYKLKPFVTEIKLKNNFHYSNTFSGTSLHIFTKERLEKIEIGFWEDKPKIVLIDNDPEFVNNSK